MLCEVLILFRGEPDTVRIRDETRRESQAVECVGTRTPGVFDITERKQRMNKQNHSSDHSPAMKPVSILVSFANEYSGDMNEGKR